MENSLFLGQKKAHWAELKWGSRDAHTCDTIDIERENTNSFSSLRSLTFHQFEVLTSTETSFLQLAERKLFPILLIGVVWTCVTYATKKGALEFRIVAQSRKSRPWLAYDWLHRNIDTSAMDRALIHWYWKMNWNWCFHSSAAGRGPSEEGDFDQLRSMNCFPNIGMKNWISKIPEKGKSGTRKGGKVCIFVSPALFLRSKPVM